GPGDPPDLASRIKHGSTPYRSTAARRAAVPLAGLRVVPPPSAPALSALPVAVRRLVRRGLGRPGRRPSARDWVDVLDRLEHDLVQCDRSPQHVHAGRRCPWCRAIDRGLPDPFPGPAGSPRLSPRPPSLARRV